MDLLNESGLPAAWLTWKIRPPAWSMVVVVKGTFRIEPGSRASLAELPLPPTGDEFVDDDLRYENDFAPWKPKVDLLVDARPSSAEVAARIGGWQKRRRPEDTKGLGPIPSTRPPRSKKTGTYGRDWLRDRWPWWPEDFDWTFYNAAPEDQQIERLSGDEDFAFVRLHPKLPELTGRLPGIRPRVFTDEKSGFHEIRMILDTLWVKPDAGTLVLVWRGHREVRSEKLEEIARLYVASEPMEGRTATGEEYRLRMEERLRKKPEKTPEPAVPPPAPPVVEEPKLSPEAEAAFERAEKQEATFSKEIGRLQAHAAEEAKRAGATLPKEGARPTPAQIHDWLKEAVSGAKRAMQDAGLPVPREWDELVAHPPEIPDPKPPPPPPEEPAAPAREDLRARIARKESLERADLTGADLSGLDLSSLNLRQAILTDAKLTGATLAGADLSGADLARADLSGADARGATFRSADLGGAKMVKIDLTGAKLAEAVCAGSDLTEARMSQVEAPGADFSRANLTGADLRRAMLVSARFAESLLDRCDFAEADLSDARFGDARGRGVKAAGAAMIGLRGAGAHLDGADFAKCRGDGSIWEGASLAKADFSYAQLKGAEFSGANLEGARMVASNPREARFVEANLRGADCTRMNLFRGTLEKADLTGANFAEANLFEAETWEAIVKDTSLRGANVLRSKLEKKE